MTIRRAPEYWRDRAVALREGALEMKTPETQELMFTAARDCEDFAEWLEVIRRESGIRIGTGNPT